MRRANRTWSSAWRRDECAGRNRSGEFSRHSHVQSEARCEGRAAGRLRGQMGGLHAADRRRFFGGRIFLCAPLARDAQATRRRHPHFVGRHAGGILDARTDHRRHAGFQAHCRRVAANHRQLSEGQRSLRQGDARNGKPRSSRRRPTARPRRASRTLRAAAMHLAVPAAFTTA